MNEWDELYAYLDATPKTYPPEFQRILDQILDPEFAPANGVEANSIQEFLAKPIEEQNRLKEEAFRAWCRDRQRQGCQ